MKRSSALMTQLASSQELLKWTSDSQQSKVLHRSSAVSPRPPSPDLSSMPPCDPPSRTQPPPP